MKKLHGDGKRRLEPFTHGPRAFSWKGFELIVCYIIALIQFRHHCVSCTCSPAEAFIRLRSLNHTLLHFPSISISFLDVWENSLYILQLLFIHVHGLVQRIPVHQRSFFRYASSSQRPKSERDGTRERVKENANALRVVHGWCWILNEACAWKEAALPGWLLFTATTR